MSTVIPLFVLDDGLWAVVSVDSLCSNRDGRLFGAENREDLADSHRRGRQQMPLPQPSPLHPLALLQ
jgi:hypothetical protein